MFFIETFCLAINKALKVRVDSAINLLHLQYTAIVYTTLMATLALFCQYVLFVGKLDGFLAGSFAILCHTSPALLGRCFPALQLKIISLD